MSIFGSLTTGISGLQAQATALGHISDNIANSRTTGYKRVDTAFTSLVLQSNQRVHNPGGVVARPNFANNVSGNIETVDRTTNLAVRGQGFFSVSRLTEVNGTRIPTQERFYTRDGSFELNDQRTLVNRSGYALNGFIFNDSTNSFSTAVTPIQVTADIDSPVPTRNVELRANLPTDPTPGQPLQPATIQIFDSTGTPRTLTIGFRPGQTDNSYRMTIDAPGAIGSLPLAGSLAGFDVDATSTSLTAGRASRSQIEEVQFTSPNGTAIKIGDIYRVTVNGVNFTETVSTQNAAQLSNLAGVAQSLADKINGSVPPVGVSATVLNGRLQLRSTAAGVPFTISTGVTNATPTSNTASGPVTTQPSTTAVQQSVVTFAGTSVDIGDVFRVGVANPNAGGAVRNYSVTVTSANIGQLRDINGVLSALAARVNSNSSSDQVVASVIGNALTLRGTVVTNPAQQPFTVDDTLGGSNFVVNATAADNTTFISTLQGNITGSQQTQRISIAGVPGDVGAVYAVTLRSPEQIITDGGTPVITPAVAGPPAVAANAVFDFTSNIGVAPTLGQRFAVTLNGSTYALQITEQNQLNFPDRASVLNELVSQVNNDFGAPFTASFDGTAIITLTAKDAATVLDGTQETPPAFNKTIAYETTGREVSLDEIAANLALKINQEGGVPVQAASVGGVLTLTANQQGVSFLGSPTSQAGTTPPHIALNFGGILPNGTDVASGTLSGISAANVGTGNATVSAVNEQGRPAQVTFSVDYGDGPQRITLDLGTFGEATGLTQYQGSAVNITSQLQDGSGQGTFRDVEIRENGDVVANYDNGRRRVIAKVPLVLFNNANALARETGGTFTETADSGRARFTDTGLNGAGTIAASSVESSNVDIAQEFTKLIVAQRSYTANTRVITTADEILTETINLKR
jgi:flagellar hook protein FlgE